MAVTLETLWPAPLDPSAEQAMVTLRDGTRLAIEPAAQERP